MRRELLLPQILSLDMRITHICGTFTSRSILNMKDASQFLYFTIRSRGRSSVMSQVKLSGCFILRYFHFVCGFSSKQLLKYLVR